MILPRRTGVYQVVHPDGRVGTTTRSQLSDPHPLIHVRLSPYATANWPRKQCRVRFITALETAQ